MTKVIGKFIFSCIKKIASLIGYTISIDEKKKSKIDVPEKEVSHYPDYVQHWINLGLRIGEYKYISADCILDYNYMFLITLGNSVTISNRVSLFTHDGAIVQLTDYIHSDHKISAKLGSINIGDRCFIGTGSIILPNTFIGRNSIVGAGSVVSGTFPESAVIAGNPARVISTLEEYFKPYNERVATSP